jgi:hypothetical protein
MMASYLEYPLSRGEIHIISKDVYADPYFMTGFLSHSADLPPQVVAYKKNREIMRRMPCFRGEYSASHPSFPDGSAAVCCDTAFPDVETEIGIKRNYKKLTAQIFPETLCITRTTMFRPRKSGTKIFQTSNIAKKMTRPLSRGSSIMLRRLGIRCCPPFMSKLISGGLVL